MAPESRTALCLECRTALVEGEPCDRCGGGSVVSLREAAGRRAAVEAAWSERAHVVPREGLGCALIGLTAILSLGAVCAAAVYVVRVRESAGAFFVVMIVGTILFLLLVGTAAVASSRLRKVRRERMPRGVDATLSPPEDLPRHEGVVVGSPGPVLTAIELRAGGETMLRDAVSRGFDVALDERRVIHVPPGRIRVDMNEEHRRPLDGHRALAWTRSLLTQSDRGQPFPFDRAWTLELHDGDAVELRAALGDETLEEAAYRSPLVERRRVAGMAWLARR